MESAFFPWKKYLGYSVAILAVIFAYSWITSPMIVTLNGSGEVSAKAETATFTFSLSSNGDSAQSATTSVRNTANRIKETLKTGGILESNIYESQIEVLPASTVSAGASGYQATISMGVKTAKINNLDGLIGDLYAQGAVVVTQPILSVVNSTELEKKAYDLAVADAKNKAGSIALSNWKLIRKIVLIEQSNTDSTSTVTSKADAVAQVEKNVSPTDGLIKIKKSVSISYKMW